jgi:CHAT domain-containing protein
MLSGNDAESGFLRAGEIQIRRLNAQLVVLSACQSGLGLVHDGGVIGLTRSFQKAGAARVVMSLWSVDDAATLAMMTRFQRNLLKDMPATALRKAMLDTRKQFPEPKYWAPFVLFGTPR